MASNRNTYQQVHNISVPRNNIVDMAISQMYSKTDYKVFLMLLTELDGFSPPANKIDYRDPLNYKKIDKKRIAERLGIKKDKVNDSIDNLRNYGIIEKGNTESIKNGYRFTF